jgi:hypothetical protein
MILQQGAFGMTLTRALEPAADGGWPGDPSGAKALVMAELTRIVDEGGAKLAALESGSLELRLATGEIFHLG